MKRLMLALMSMLALAAAAPARAADDQVIVIERSRVTPGLAITALEGRVVFDNRTGHPVHLEFTGPPAEHEVFRIDHETAAVFHRPGRHPYVVHLLAESGELAGVVEVTNEMAPGAIPAPECSITITGVCIER